MDDLDWVPVKETDPVVAVAMYALLKLRRESVLEEEEVTKRVASKKVLGF